MKRTKAQSDRFHGLVYKLGLDRDEKKEIVKDVSTGRCISSKDLTANEMQKAINILSGQQTSRIERMRAKARAISSDIGLIRMKDGKADYSALNTFILNKFKVSSLFDLDQTNLSNCITALERWREGLTKKMVKEAIFKSENE